MNTYLFIAYTILGLINGFANYLYGYGLSCLPVSTGGLIVVLLTMGAIVIALHASSDRPANEYNTQYYMGFAMIVNATLINELTPPLIKLMYKKLKQGITYSLVMEI
uniref:Uncharacterized protein n=1 Tax=Nelumbo nucifera TaxID=4432 RepID=A0A822XS72_NELNU|nr:TPA_asm: hypothetical protein HUJ06_023249 [Nelumbo nucifera]